MDTLVSTRWFYSHATDATCCRPAGLGNYTSEREQHPVLPPAEQRAGWAVHSRAAPLNVAERRTNAQTRYCFAGGASWEPLINLRTMLESSPDQPTPVSSAPQRAPVARLTPQSPPTKTLSAVIKYGGGIIALVIAAGICFQFFGKATISSIEDVQKYFVGTWTDTSGKEFWNKLIFKRDGSVEEYLARPWEDNWGKAMMKTWKPITAKYSDTGLRYYGIEVTGFGNHLVLTDDGHLRFSIGPDLRMEFTKGDKFPFSK